MQTCAADGSCAGACPVAIDTGKLIKEFRSGAHGPRAERAALELARRYAKVEAAGRAALAAGGLAARAVGDRRLARVSEAVRRRVGSDVLPAWSPTLPRPASATLPSTTRQGAAAVYLPSCLNRIFGAARTGQPGPTLPEALVHVSARAGLPVWIPDDVAGHCCGVPWSSKGFAAGHREMARRTTEALRRWSGDGRLPVVIDASSCTLGVVSELGIEDVEVLDAVAWVHDRLLDRLEIGERLDSLLVHPTCACTQLGLAGKLAATAARMAEDVVIPAGTTCCGQAGDRGWLHPELPRSALQEVRRETEGRQFDGCVSSNRTCELALHRETGRAYSSVVLLLERLTR
jgi:D-lactate dehydrogenase